MARPRRLTIDYFPHFVKCGRTIFILESKFGNDGYAFWFKLLEILGETEGHFYDCKTSTNWEYLLAKTRLNAEMAEQVIDALISLGKIDGELWTNNRVIWVANFVNNLIGVYKERRTALPLKPRFSPENPDTPRVSNRKTITPQEFPDGKPDKEKESIVKESKGEDKDHVILEKITNLYHSVCKSYPRIVKLTESRKHKMLIRFQDEMKGDWALLERVFRKMEESKFMRGDNKKGWTATLDWLISNDKNWVKVAEGNYDNHVPKNNSNPTANPNDEWQ